MNIVIDTTENIIDILGENVSTLEFDIEITYTPAGLLSLYDPAEPATIEIEDICLIACYDNDGKMVEITDKQAEGVMSVIDNDDLEPLCWDALAL